jgi:hypothetical protein
MATLTTKLEGKFLMKLVVIFLFIAICGFSESINAAPAFGRYTGILRHANVAQDQLVRLDFITEQESNGLLKLRANMVLFFGGFDSAEYASYDFDKVTYNLLNGTLVFDTAERELHFIVHNFKDGHLQATVRTGVGNIGELILDQGDQAKPERPLLHPLWGEYRGICHGVGERLQIQTTPPTQITTSRSDRFAIFGIRAQKGENSRKCFSDVGTCINAVFNDGEYDFFNGHLDLHGDFGTLSCSVDQGGLTCKDCRFQRHSNERVENKLFVNPTSQPMWSIPDASTSSGLAGYYKGYVHLEQRDLLQPISIQISTYRQTPDGSGSETLMVSLVSNLYFGGHSDTDATISTKFDPRPLNLMNAQPIFDRADHNTDMIIKILNFKGSVIEGEWHSRRFGRVGRFAVSSGQNIVQLQDDAKLAPVIASRFDNGNWNLFLQVVFSDNSATSKDPFSPLALHGWAQLKGLTPRISVQTSTYDPFTGKFLLDLGDQSFMIGKRTSTGALITRPSNRILKPMLRHELLFLKDEQP